METRDIFIDVDWIAKARENIEEASADEVVGKDKLRELYTDTSFQHIDIGALPEQIGLRGTACRYDPSQTQKWRDLLPLIVIAMAVVDGEFTLTDFKTKLTGTDATDQSKSHSYVHPFWEWFEGQVQEMNLGRWLRENDEHRDALDPPEGLFES